MDEGKTSSLEDLRRELRKDWRHRFWYAVYTPRFWLENQYIKHRKWLERHFVGRLFIYVIWRWNDDVYCPFCGACGEDGCCPAERCDGGAFCPYKTDYEEQLSE